MVVKNGSHIFTISVVSGSVSQSSYSHIFKKERKTERKGQHCADTEVESERETQVQMAQNREVRLKGADKGRTGSGPEEMEETLQYSLFRGGRKKMRTYK